MWINSRFRRLWWVFYVVLAQRALNRFTFGQRIEKQFQHGHGTCERISSFRQRVVNIVRCSVSRETSLLEDLVANTTDAILQDAVLAHALLDNRYAVLDGCMRAATEVLADVGKGVVGELARKPYGNVTWFHELLVSATAHELRVVDAITRFNSFLYLLDGNATLTRRPFLFSYGDDVLLSERSAHRLALKREHKTRLNETLNNTDIRACTFGHETSKVLAYVCVDSGDVLLSCVGAHPFVERIDEM